jgi:hypothetical protein
VRLGTMLCPADCSARYAPRGAIVRAVCPGPWACLVRSDPGCSSDLAAPGCGSSGGCKGSAIAVLTKLVWENMKTRCATSRQRLLSRLTTVERAWRPLVSQVQTKDITVLTRWSGDSAELRLTAAW